MDSQEASNLLEQVKAAFQAEKALGVNAAVQLNLSGGESGQFYIKIQDQALTAGTGAVDNPRVTLFADSKDLVDIFQGRLDPMSAYFSGRLQVKGDMNFAMRLAGLFRR